MNLKQQLAAKLAEVEALRKLAVDEKRELTDAECDKLDALLGDAEALQAKVKAEDRRVTLAARASGLKVGDGAGGGRKVPPLPSAPALPGSVRVRSAALADPTLGFRNLADVALTLKDCGPGAGAIHSHERFAILKEYAADQQSMVKDAAAGSGMVQGITADGGILVPPAFSNELWDGARQASESMLQFCDVRMIDPGVQSLTFAGINETSRANGSRWGGVVGAWKTELAQMTQESKPKFRDVKVEPQELYVLGYISDKLLRDAPGTASGILAKAAADELNFKIGDAICNGDGAGKPRGWIGHASSISIAKETNQAAATILAQNINKMYGAMHSSWRQGAVWFINQECEALLELLTIDVGTGGQPLFVPPGGIADAPYARLKGKQIIPIEYAAAKGTKGDISFVNLKAYLVGLRGLVDQNVSMHLKFDFAQSCFRFIFEVDGQPWMALPITPFKGSQSTSPIVTLDTRA